MKISRLSLFFFAFSLIAMEDKKNHSSNVPSLRLLSFLVVQANIQRIGHSVGPGVNAILDVIDSEHLADDPFENARFVDMFKLTDLLNPAAKKLAQYIDSHSSALERRKALDNLVGLSDVMRKRVSDYRKK